MPNLREEKKLWKRGYKRVVGLDEVGRGALAGPVVAAAVLIKNSKFEIRNSKLIKNSKFEIRNPKLIKNPKFEIRNPKKIPNWNLDIVSNFDIRISNLKLRDSKKLTSKTRAKFYKILTTHPAIEWAIGKVSEKVIDRINILEATKLAMKKAIKNLTKKLTNSTIVRNIKLVDFLVLDGKMKLDLPIPQKAIVKADEKVFSCALASILAKVTRDKIMERYHKKYPVYGFDKHKGYPTKLHLKKLRKYGFSKIHRKTFQPLKSLLK